MRRVCYAPTVEVEKGRPEMFPEIFIAQQLSKKPEASPMAKVKEATEMKGVASSTEMKQISHPGRRQPAMKKKKEQK